MINIIQLKKFMHGLIQMVKTYPTLATSFTVGKSYEQREMKGLKISSNKKAVKRDGTQVNKKKLFGWMEVNNGFILFYKDCFENIFPQVCMLENGLVQQRLFILLMLFYQIITKIQQLHISSIN